MRCAILLGKGLQLRIGARIERGLSGIQNIAFVSFSCSMWWRGHTA
jgi:hypothetical protein